MRWFGRAYWSTAKISRVVVPFCGVLLIYLLMHLSELDSMVAGIALPIYR